MRTNIKERAWGIFFKNFRRTILFNLETANCFRIGLLVLKCVLSYNGSTFSNNAGLC